MSDIVVYGKGKTGENLKKMLTGLGKTAVMYDDASGFESKAKFCKKSLVLLSPGVPPYAKGVAVARKRGAYIMGELELCFLLCLGKCISVTGTNGKTTVCEMIYKILRDCGVKARLLGNGGVPFCSQVMDVKSDEFVVLESSSFQLDTCRNFDPYISVCTNIATDHLNYHKSVESYINAKKNNFVNQQAGFAVFNLDDAACVDVAQECRCERLFYSLNNSSANCFIDDKNIILQSSDKSKVISAPFIDRFVKHNRSNALAAILACCANGVDPQLAVRSLQNYVPLPHRLQEIAVIDGVHFIDDSKATNVHATVSALQCVELQTALIMGGSDKGENFDAVFANLPANVIKVAAVGDTAKKISADAARYGVCAEICDDLIQAVQVCYRHIKSCGEGAVLMSNACASFDKFGSYAERGDYFKKAVMLIKSESKKD